MPCVYPKGFCTVGPFGYVIAADMAPQFHEFIEFAPRSDDIWVCGFPRSGTTMLQELTWLVGNDFNYDAARSKHIQERVPCFGSVKGRENPQNSMQLEEATNQRFIKSHNYFGLQPSEYSPSKHKTIFIYRDPRDVCVSYYHHHKSFFNYQGSIEEFVDSFIAGVVQHCPYFEWLKSWWDVRESNILVLTFEGMITDLQGTIQKVGAFLGKEVSQENAEKLETYLNISNMKGNPSIDLDQSKERFESKFQLKSAWVNNFIRKGQIGSHKEELSQISIDKLNKWMKNHGEKLVKDWSYAQYI